MQDFPRAALDSSSNPIFIRFMGEDCWIQFDARYATAPAGEGKGAWCMRLRMKNPLPDDTDLMTTITVNVDLTNDFETAEMLASGWFVLVKTWSENSGLLELLVEAGILEDTGERIKAGFSEAALCHLLVSTPDGPPLSLPVEPIDRFASYLGHLPKGEPVQVDPATVKVFDVDGDVYLAIEPAQAIEAHYARHGCSAYDVVEMNPKEGPKGELFTWGEIVSRALALGVSVPGWIKTMVPN